MRGVREEMILDFGLPDRPRRPAGGPHGAARPLLRGSGVAWPAGSPAGQPGRRPPVVRSIEARSASEATSRKPACKSSARTASA